MNSQEEQEENFITDELPPCNWKMTSVFDQRDLNEHEFNQEMAVRTGRLPQTVDMREANARKAYEERTIDVSYDLINTLKIKQTYFHNVD